MLVPVFLALGNHETTSPKIRAEYLAQFADWLTVPALSPDVAGGFLGVWAGVLAVGDGSIRVDALEVSALD